MNQEQQNIINTTIAIFKKEYGCDVLATPMHRRRDKVENRAILMKIVRDTTSLPLCEIGRIFKTKTYIGKDHASVMHNCKVAENLIETEPQFEKKYNHIKAHLVDIIPYLKGDEVSHYELVNANKQLTRLRERTSDLINRDINRKQLMISVQRKVNLLPHRYKKCFLTIFKSNNIYDKETEKIFT